jgi:hypothetical protein
VSYLQTLSGQVRELQSSKDSKAALLGQTEQQLQELGAEHSKLQEQLRELTQVGAGGCRDSLLHAACCCFVKTWCGANSSL